MSTVFRRGDIWYARFIKDGRVVVKSTKETEKEKAEEMLQKLIDFYGDKTVEASPNETEVDLSPKPRRTRRSIPKLVKLNGIWYIRTRHEGKYKFKSTKQKDKGSAEKIFQQFVDTGEMPVIPRRVSPRSESATESFRRDLISYLKLINKQLENLNRKLDSLEKQGKLTTTEASESRPYSNQTT